MGEYWFPINLTRKEWLMPHHLGNGLKWKEWAHLGSTTLQFIQARWPTTDLVLAVSDAGRLKLLDGRDLEPRSAYVGPTYEQLEMDYPGAEGWTCITTDPFAKQLDYQVRAEAYAEALIRGCTAYTCPKCGTMGKPVWPDLSATIQPEHEYVVRITRGCNCDQG